MQRACTAISLALAGNALLGVGAWAQVTHLDGHATVYRGPVSNAAVDGAFRQMAAQFRSHAPVPRVANWDVAYPADSAEYVAMHGYALLVVTAIDQDSSELPPVRVYVVTQQGTVELPLIIEEVSVEQDTAIRATFGVHRVDALYLLPMSVRSEGGDLLLDFARNRQGFRLTRFDRPMPPDNQVMLRFPTAANQPSLDVVARMVLREYPDLASTLLAGAGK